MKILTYFEFELTIKTGCFGGLATKFDRKSFFSFLFHVFCRCSWKDCGRNQTPELIWNSGRI